MVQTRGRQQKRKRDDTDTSGRNVAASSEPTTKKARALRAKQPTSKVATKVTPPDTQATAKTEKTEALPDLSKALNWQYYADEHLDKVLEFLNAEFQRLTPTDDFNTDKHPEVVNEAFTLFHYSTGIHRYAKIRDEILRLYEAVEEYAVATEPVQLFKLAQSESIDIWQAMKQLSIDKFDVSGATKTDLGDEWIEFQKQYASRRGSVDTKSAGAGSRHILVDTKPASAASRLGSVETKPAMAASQRGSVDTGPASAAGTKTESLKTADKVSSATSNELPETQQATTKRNSMDERFKAAVDDGAEVDLDDLFGDDL